MINHPNRRGALPPLFDRIKAVPTLGEKKITLLNQNELLNSVIHEVKIMLNTQCTVRRSVYENHMNDVLVYGIPDLLGFPNFSYFDAANTQDWGRVATLLEITLQAVEPRLQNIKVDIQDFDAQSQELQVTISGKAQSGPLTQNIRFPLVLSKDGVQPFLSKAS